MGKNSIVFKKIELDLFIKTLVEIYNLGADYIDLVGEAGGKQSVITILIQDEYYAEDANELLSDEDLNELL